jgi:hypothetical protein
VKKKKRNLVQKEKKLLELIKWVQQGYKIQKSIYKNQFYFYVLCNELCENEIKKTSFSGTSKWVKFLGITLTKEA